MSGGVDSSLAAVLLKERGYDVTGVYLECWRAPGCRAQEDRKDALDVALKLGIPFRVLDFKEAYKEKVVEYFFREYEVGRTPNPDVLCNKEIKFGLFYDWAMENGFDYVATGHYAQILDNQLVSSKDTWKDQTYFLYRLRSDQLPNILFPVGHLTKKQVRKIAQEKDLLVAKKPDSQGICFIGEINVHNFLKERLGERPGEVVDTKGNVIGQHRGLWFYTIGQRHGFEVRVNNTSIPPFYVIAKDSKKNRLVVGFGAETYRHSFEVEDLHWIQGNTHLSSPFVRIRHTGKLIPCQVEKISNTKIKVILDEPVAGIAAGQSAVFYEKNVCMGGGVIV